MLGICERIIRLDKARFQAHLSRFKGVPSNPKTLEEHLHVRRVELDLSMRQLASLLGIDYHAISTWEQGLYNPSREYRKRVVEFLGYDPEAPFTNQH